MFAEHFLYWRFLQMKCPRFRAPTETLWKILKKHSKHLFSVMFNRSLYAYTPTWKMQAADP